MKVVIAFVLMLFLLMTTYNWYEIHSLRQEITRLETNLKEQSAKSETDDMIAKATVALGQARMAINSTDMNKARQAFETAKTNIDMASKTAREKSAPALKWIQDEANDLQKQVQQRLSK